MNGVNGMRYSLIFSLFLFVMVSCQTKKAAKVGVLNPEEMVSTLMDIYIAEQKVNALSLTQDSAKILFARLNAKVMESKNMQDSVFKKSFNYYLDRPAEMELIYTALVDSLSLHEQRFLSQQDSIPK